MKALFCLLIFYVTNVFALPVFTDTQFNIYTDHEDQKVIYYVPDNVVLKSFSMVWTKPNIPNGHDGNLAASFQPEESVEQQNILNDLRQRGFQVKLLPVMKIGLIHNSAIMNKETSPLTRLTDKFDVEAKLRNSEMVVKHFLDGKYVPDYFSFCFQFDAMTPEIYGSYHFTNQRILREFMDRDRTLSKSDVRFFVERMLKDKEIRFKITRGHFGDLVTVVTEKILDDFFKEDHSGSDQLMFVFDENVYDSSNLETFELKGRYPIKQEICSQVSMDMAKGQKEYFQFRKKL